MSENNRKNDFNVDDIIKEVEKRRSERATDGAITPDLPAEPDLNPSENDMTEPMINSDFINRDGEYIRPSAAVRFFNSLYAWVETIVCSVVFAFVIVMFFFRMNDVYGVSMQPTLYEGDRLIVQECFYDPSYGDIVAIQADHLPNTLTGEMGELIVKRIIGLSGDEIYIEPETGVVFRNGEALSEDYTAAPIDEHNMGNLTYPVVVPEGCVFVLGDNRNHSTDSRYADNGTGFYVGFIDADYIIGRALLRVWPLERFGVI